MGTWTVPSTVERAAILEAAMQGPIRASIAKDVLGDALGDDMLWDLIEEAEDINPLSDVRPLVARHLEELTRWSIPSDFLHHWELGVRERMEFIACAFEGADLPPLKNLAIGDDVDSATGRVVEALRIDQGWGRNMTAVRIAPGVHAVQDLDAETVFRVESRYGLVVAAPDEIRDELKERFFPTMAPRFN